MIDRYDTEVGEMRDRDRTTMIVLYTFYNYYSCLTTLLDSKLSEKKGHG